MLTKRVLILFLYCIVTNVFSQRGGENVFTFLNLPTSPKQVALGGFAITSKNDVGQTLWNPSLASDQVHNHIQANITPYVSDINVGSFVFSHTLNPKYGATFLGVQFVDYGDLDGRDANNNPTGNFTAQDIAYSIGHSYSWKEFDFGASVKYVLSQIDIYKSNALLVDLGLTYHSETKPLNVSLVYRNLGNQITAYRDQEEEVASNLILAMDYTLEHVPLKLFVAFDEINNWDISAPNPSDEETDLEGNVSNKNISDAENAFRHLSFGAELWSNKKFNVRIGYNARRALEFQLAEIRTNAGISYGFGFKTKYIHFNYAFSKFQEGAKSSTFGLTIDLH